MRIAVYCQHVLGMGHVFRTLAILDALAGHDRLLLLGGPSIPVAMPEGVALRHLPELAMDAAFSGLTLSGDALEAVKADRRETLLRELTAFSPDVFFVELYPFGRKAFEFELVPALTAIRQGRFGRCRVVCGVRDILVEKKDPAAYEARVIDRLKRYFDAVAVHADPTLFPLGATFSRADDMPVPVTYTGYVAPPRTPTRPRAAVRSQLAVAPPRQLLVASAGGGKVGGELLEATLAACRAQPRLGQLAVRVFSGPYCDDAAYDRLTTLAAALPDAKVARFADGFVDILAAADLSVSLAGYNTVMGLLAAGCRGLVLPFDQNREQRLRAERLRDAGLLHLLDAAELPPDRLAPRLLAALDAPPPPKAAVDLDGARNTATLLHSFI